MVLTTHYPERDVQAQTAGKSHNKLSTPYMPVDFLFVCFVCMQEIVERPFKGIEAGWTDLDFGWWRKPLAPVWLNFPRGTEAQIYFKSAALRSLATGGKIEC